MPVSPDAVLAQLGWRYATKKFDPARTVLRIDLRDHLTALKRLGVPYSDDMIANAASDALGQASPDTDRSAPLTSRHALDALDHRRRARGAARPALRDRAPQCPPGDPREDDGRAHALLGRRRRSATPRPVVADVDDEHLRARPPLTRRLHVRR